MVLESENYFEEVSTSQHFPSKGSDILKMGDL